MCEDRRRYVCIMVWVQWIMPLKCIILSCEGLRTWQTSLLLLTYHMENTFTYRFILVVLQPQKKLLIWRNGVTFLGMLLSAGWKKKKKKALGEKKGKAGWANTGYAILYFYFFLQHLWSWSQGPSSIVPRARWNFYQIFFVSLPCWTCISEL